MYDHGHGGQGNAFDQFVGLGEVLEVAGGGSSPTESIGLLEVGGVLGSGEGNVGGQCLLVLADPQKVTGCFAGDEVIDVLGIEIEPGGMAGVKLGELARDVKSGGSSG